MIVFPVAMIVFFVVSMFALRDDLGAVLTGGALLGLFVVLLAMGAWVLFSRRFLLRINAAGIESQRQGFAFEWASIRGVYVAIQRPDRGPACPLVAIDGTPRRARRIAAVNRYGLRKVGIPEAASAGTVSWLGGTAPSIDEALAAIRTFAPHVPIVDLR